MENEGHETFISHDNNKQDCQIANLDSIHKIYTKQFTVPKNPNNSQI